MQYFGKALGNRDDNFVREYFKLIVLGELIRECVVYKRPENEHVIRPVS